MTVSTVAIGAGVYARAGGATLGHAPQLGSAWVILVAALIASMVIATIKLIQLRVHRRRAERADSMRASATGSEGGGALFERIVVGTDGSDTAAEAVRQATELAKAHRRRARDGERLRAGSAATACARRPPRSPATSPTASARARTSTRRSRAPPAPARRGRASRSQTHAREGDPADAILDVAEETKADLIVVGNKGMTGAKRFLLGSVPNKISHHAPCGVYIVRTT